MGGIESPEYVLRARKTTRSGRRAFLSGDEKRLAEDSLVGPPRIPQNDFAKVSYTLVYG
jgi:hypothetical protein